MTDATYMNSAEFLQHVGHDAAKWASEFRRIALTLGYSDMDEGWLIGWFANAIAAGERRAEQVSVQEAGVLSGGMIWESRGEIHLSFDTREQLDAAYDALEAMLAPVDPARALAADKKE